ncbi:phage protein Gp36 family protein [Sulfurimonas sp.]
MMITNEDLLKEISERELTQLSDINATGSTDQSVVDDALNDAISFVESFIILPENPTPLLKKIVVDLTIYELRRKNELVSDSDKELKKENEAYLSKMSNGRLRTEVTPTSTASVDNTTSSFAFAHQNRKRIDRDGFR